MFDTLLEGAVWNSTTKANESEGGNDNNLPFSSSRLPNKADDNELILLEVDEFLRAKQSVSSPGCDKTKKQNISKIANTKKDCWLMPVDILFCLFFEKIFFA